MLKVNGYLTVRVGGPAIRGRKRRCPFQSRLPRRTWRLNQRHGGSLAYTATKREQNRRPWRRLPATEHPSGLEKGLAKCNLVRAMVRTQRTGPGPKNRPPTQAFERTNALVAQLDRASDFESEGREFESLRARQDPFAALHPPSLAVGYGREPELCKTAHGSTPKETAPARGELGPYS